MSKNKYAHLVHDGNVVYMPGCGPMHFQFSPEREAAIAAEASRIRRLGHTPFVAAGTDIRAPQARRQIYGLPPSGSAGQHW